jgi:proline iminopeptidase
VILVDQRGCGNSTPFADLTDNTTWDLVRDFEKVRKKLKVDRWQVFGGSWGSTLALAYAVTHPERTTEIVLRGIFLLSKQELDWFYEGVGTKYIYPEEWEAYEAAIPEAERGDGFINAYYKRLMGHMGEDAKYEAAKAWSIYEGSVSKLHQPPKAYLANKYGTGHFPLAFARIENHYFVNKGFFKRDNWLLEDAQMDKIKDIPTVMVHGRYDALCPAGTAWALHKKLPKSELFFTITGHSGFETDIIEKLVYATEKYKSRK